MKGMKKFLTIILFSFFAITLVACGTSPLEGTPTGENFGSFGTYDNLKEYLLEYYDDENDNYYTAEGALTTTAMDGVDFDSQEDATTETRDYSKTNNQVDGVQESDRILTDGYKIYILSGNKFFIVDADTLNIDYEFEFMEDNADIYSYGYLDDMYLYDNKIILTSYVYSYQEIQIEDCKNTTTTAPAPAISDESDDDVLDESGSEDYYYDPCIAYDYSYGTKVIVLDVEDTLDVTLFRELYFDSAHLVNTRMIDEQMYLVLDNYMIRYSFSEEIYVPRYMDSAVSNDLQELSADNIFFMPRDVGSFGYLVLASFDVTSNEEVNVKAYLGNTWQMYMSLNNLYTIISRWSYDEDTQRSSYSTFVVRFEIENGELVYKAIGEIEGSPLNQFSMDEYDGVFRIATTGYSYTDLETDNWEWNIDNFLFCLDATADDDMTELSVLTGLGKPGETIYSVRFSNETAYVVTFQQIDPLYKLDLSDPENPVILGELEEEGVSDYLHVISDDLMIGIGRQAVVEEWGTRFTGVKVALYNTSGDVPINLETYLVEGEYSYTNVKWDHKSFVYFTPEDEDFTYVAVPIYEYFEDYYGYSQSLYVFKITHDGDLELLSKLSHMEEQEEGNYAYYDSIERAVMIENYIYTVSYSSIKAFDIDNNFVEVNSQVLNQNYYSVWGYPGTDAVTVETVD